MAKRLTVKHVETRSVAKFVGVVNALIAVVVGLIGGIAATVTYLGSGDFGVIETVGLSIAIVGASIVLYPLFMYLIGWLYGALAAIIFNVFVGVSGGIAINVDEETLSKN